MSFKKLSAQLSAAASTQLSDSNSAKIKVSIKETGDTGKGTVKVVDIDGKVHKGSWGPGSVSRVTGDKFILMAALSAWSGPLEFELTPKELEEQSDGWWAVK